MDHKYEVSKFLFLAISPGVLKVLATFTLYTNHHAWKIGLGVLVVYGSKERRKEISSFWIYKNSSNKVSGTLRKRLFVNCFLSQTRRSRNIKIASKNAFIRIDTSILLRNAKSKAIKDLWVSGSTILLVSIRQCNSKETTGTGSIIFLGNMLNLTYSFLNRPQILC